MRERRLHQRLVLGVERGGRLVEQQQRGTRRIARAIAMRCRSPPDSMTPRSPTGVSSPCGRRAMNSEAAASAAARRTSASDASGRPKRMFSATLAANTIGVLRHQRDVRAQLARIDIGEATPSNVTSPESGS